MCLWLIKIQNFHFIVLDGAILGGVCSGLSESLNSDLTIIRILFLIPLLVFGTGALAYIVCWIVFPEKETY